MSNKVFPEFQGWSVNKTKTPLWKTNIYEAESGVETRIQKWSFPRYKMALTFNFMTDNKIQSINLTKGDLERLQGFFNSVGGPFEDFLYRDDVENTVENQVFAVSNGTTKSFQLVRSLPNWVEAVTGMVEPPKIFVDGVETSDFTFDAQGVVTFNESPGSIENPATLSWSGNYYFRCRFEDDEIELTRTWDGLWENIVVNLITVK